MVKKPAGSAEKSSANKIPSFVAGTWQERDGIQRLVIEPNGIVSSAVSPLGQIVVRPHQTTEMKMTDGNVSTFTGGDFLAEYNPDTRELFVIVNIKEIHVRFITHRMNGSIVDRYFGPVSEDGTIWTPEGISIPDYGPQMPQDYNLVEPVPLIFDKVEPASVSEDGSSKIGQSGSITEASPLSRTTARPIWQNRSGQQFHQS